VGAIAINRKSSKDRQRRPACINLEEQAGEVEQHITDST
jgi:hypothetical protein